MDKLDSRCSHGVCCSILLPEKYLAQRKHCLLNNRRDSCLQNIASIQASSRSIMQKGKLQVLHSSCCMVVQHVGIPTTARFDGEIPLPDLQMTASDHQDNPFGIQWQRYWEGAPYPELVKSVPHVAFEVDDLEEALQGQHILIEPNSPSPGVRVAFIQVRGAPVELMQIDHLTRPDL